MGNPTASKGVYRLRCTAPEFVTFPNAPAFAGAKRSGKFDTHFLVCRFGALGMNMSHAMGQRVLLGP